MKNKIERFLVISVLAGNVLFQGFYLPGFDLLPLYLIILIGLGIFELISWIIGSKSHTKGLRGIPIVIIFILANIAFSLVINECFDIKSYSLIAFSALFCLACFNSVIQKKDISWLLNGYVIMVMFSSLVEIGQFLNIEWFDNLWELTHLGDKLSESILAGRYLGMASDALQFGYQCSAAISILLFKKIKKGNSWIKIVPFLILITALLINNTRSAQIAVIFLIIVWLFSSANFVKNRLFRNVLSLSVIAVAIAYIPMSDLYLNSRFANILDSAGSMARIPMILTAFNHGIKYPLGMGNYVVQPDLVVGANNSTFSFVVDNGAHNIFGNCIACFGFLGLILLIVFYSKVFIIFFNYRKFLINELKYEYLAIICAITALVINALFHNSYILNGDFSSWFFIGIFLTLPKLVGRNKHNYDIY